MFSLKCFCRCCGRLDYYYYYYYYYYICLLQLGCHPVAAVQYTFTHKLYKEIIHRTTQQFWKSAGRAPSWLVIPWHLRKGKGKGQRGGVWLPACRVGHVLRLHTQTQRFSFVPADSSLYVQYKNVYTIPLSQVIQLAYMTFHCMLFLTL